MTRIYAFANQKGGVGKTTSVVNMSAILGSRGMRTLIIDLDPQANATSALGYNKNRLELSSYELLLQGADLEQVRIRNESFCLDIVPASPSLAGAEVELVEAMAREYRLQRALQASKQAYDYVLIDCPPSLGLLTVNALTSANGILIPVQCEYLALEGLTQLSQTLELVRTYLNPGLAIRGLMMTMYDGRTNLSRQVVDEVRSHFGERVFRTIVPRSVRLSEAPSYGQPIHIYAPNTPGAVAYQLLSAELLKGDRQELKSG